MGDDHQGWGCHTINMGRIGREDPQHVAFGNVGWPRALNREYRPVERAEVNRRNASGFTRI